MPRTPRSMLLSLGTGLALALGATPAIAAPPDLGIDWGAEVKAAKTKAKPRPSAPRPAKRAPSKPTTTQPEAPPEPPAPEPLDEPTPSSEPAIDPPPATPPGTAAPPAPRVVPPPADPITPARRSPARAELITGSVLAVGGLAALGVLANGLYVHRISERELARGGAYPPELLAPIERQHERSETRIAAGAIVGVVGLALGTALIVAGARELRLSPRSHARVRVAPTPGGLLLTGRF